MSATDTEKKRALVVPDLHGRYEYLFQAQDQFNDEKYDYLILLGDYVDSFDRNDEDMVLTVRKVIALKKKFPDQVIALLGNHDIQYMYNPDYRCSGYRASLSATLKTLFYENRTLFQVGFQLNHLLFTHAGVNQRWYNRYEERLTSFRERHGLQESSFAELLNAVAETSAREWLFEVGAMRGGLHYDTGGVVWCDEQEILQYNPLKGYHQIVGHTPQPEIKTVNKFNGNSDESTSVTFCDVLGGRNPSFLSLIV